ncbi:hypothetical protein ACGFR6_04250 [Streptomyces sp. NPDC048567]|uniref:hypothetical protein n=1 Tax=Streptomyces sp. NPDC048567 TaxID=3365570 RepID=UPI00371DEEEC
MRQKEPEFYALEYVTITKEPRTGLVLAMGGADEVADILQREGGFLSAPGPRGPYHRLPLGLPVEQQRLKATAASHALLAAGYRVHLDPALNALTTPDGDRDAALRYLAHLAERAAGAKTSSQVADVLTEICAPETGLLTLTREVVVRAYLAAVEAQPASPTADPDPIARLTDIADSLTRATQVVGHVRDHAANHSTPVPGEPRTTPNSPAHQHADQTAAGDCQVPALPAQLRPDRPRPHVPAGGRPAGGRPR